MSDSAKDGRVFGIIPAAGLSRRMGRAKQLILIEGRPMLLAVIERVVRAGLSDVVVVTRSEVSQSLDLPTRDGFRVVINDDPETAMIDSILIGVDCLTEKSALQDGDGLLVLPGDCPGVTMSVIEQCVRVFRSDSSRIVVAVHTGRRGHPLVVPSGFLPEIRSIASAGGLNQLLQIHAESVFELECREAGVLTDVDSPGDSAKLQMPRET